MDPELYLKKHHVLTYIEDAVTFLLERKDEDPKTKPFQVLADYFQSVRSGSHVLFREYAFVMTTPHNRLSFVRVFWQSYTEIASRGELMRVSDYLSLLRLHCRDFPSEIVQKVGLVIFSHGAMESMVSFPDFLYTFQVVFLYEYFLSRCEELCCVIASGHGSLRPTVSVPSSAEQDAGSSSRPTSGTGERGRGGGREGESESIDSNKSIDAEVFLKAVANLVHRIVEGEPWHSCPSMEAVREALSGVRSLSFYDFVLALSRSEKVNTEIGALPPKIPNTLPPS